VSVSSSWMWRPSSPGHRWDDRVWVNRVATGTGEDGAGSVDSAPNMATGVALVNTKTNAGRTVRYAAVSQTGAGTTVLAAAEGGLKHKIIGATLTLSGAGTLKFTGAGDLSGAMDVAAKGGFVIPPSEWVWQQTGANEALSLVTTAGMAQGVVQYITEA